MIDNSVTKNKQLFEQQNIEEEKEFKQHNNEWTEYNFDIPHITATNENDSLEDLPQYLHESVCLFVVFFGVLTA